LPGGTPARPPQAPAPESKGRVADENTRITREPTPPQRPASARAAAPAPVQEQSDVTDIEEFKRAQKPPPPARDEEEEHTAEFKHPQTRVETIENQRPREADEAETTGPVAKPQSLQPRPPVGKSGQLSRPQLIVAGVVAGLIVAIAIAGYVQSLSPSKRDLMNLYIAGFNGEKVDPPVDKIAFDLQSKEPCRTHSDDRCFIYKVTAPRYTGAMIVFKGAEDWEREKDANASKR
jgi:hypothetical protein